MLTKTCVRCLSAIALTMLLMSSVLPTRAEAGTLINETPANPSVTLNLRDYGATGDGTTDDGPALQNALDALADAGGGTLFVPAGRYAIITSVSKDFAGLAQNVTIQGVESSTPVPPPTAWGHELSRGLDLVSEFYPRTGTQHSALSIKGLQSFLIKDIAFIGTPDVDTDALITLNIDRVDDAVVRHCEFYGLSTQEAGGAIVQAIASRLTLERSVFLGCTANSGIYTSVVQNFFWKGITVTEAVFIDYGQRSEFFGKTGLAAPFSWVNISNAISPDHNSPRREVVIKSVFLDEGGMYGLSSIPNPSEVTSAPIDLLYITGLFMNVSNLNASGHHLADLKGLLIENSHYGWSHTADTAIDLINVNNAILDRVECVDNANRIRADAATGRLTVINSIYNELASEAQITQVIAAAEDDPVEYVRSRFTESLGREPDAAAHFFWSDRLLQCNTDEQCETSRRTDLDNYLANNPQPQFAITGRVVEEEGGAGMPGVTVTLGGSQTVVTQTDAEGRYSFSNLPTSGIYTVTPTLRHYTVTPASFEIVTPAGDQVLESSMTFNHHSINGFVTDENGSALCGVTMTLSGSESATTITAADGSYSFEDLPAGGNYVVHASLTSYAFTPISKVLNDLAADHQLHFTGTFVTYTIGGIIVNVNNQGLAGIPVTLSGSQSGTTITDSSGHFSFTDVPSDGNYSVTPSVIGLAFSPVQNTYSALDANKFGVYVATFVTHTEVPNPIDDAHFFVRQQYRDFLNREPDAAGLDFWANQIIACGTDASCRTSMRQHVSAAFFLSIEFQETGFLAYRLYKSAHGRAPRRVEEFLFDTRLIGENVIVGTPNWEQSLEANKVNFLNLFVERPEFVERYPLTLTPAQFVEALNVNTGLSLTPNEVAAAVAEFEGAANISDTAARRRAIRKVAENPAFVERETRPAFVRMQYFGYLQRNPDDPPDSNLDGYNFWLGKLNEFNGNYEGAEMVRAFIESIEYRTRFGR